MKKRNLLLVLAALLCVTTLFAQKKVAFVYQSGYNVSKYVWDANGYNPTLDPIHIALASTFTVTDFVYTQTQIPDTTLLKTFDLVVMSEAMSGAQPLSNNMLSLVGDVPMLNMKAYVYTSGRWSWAPPANPATKTTSVTINPGFESHEIFKGLEVANGVVQIFDGSSTVSHLVQGFGTPIATGLIEQDKLIANVTGTTSYAIHEIANLSKKYMLIPISSDVVTTVSPNGVKLVINACNYLMGGASGFDPDAPFKIAYLYDSSYSGYVGIENDPIFNNSVIAEKECISVDIKSFTAASTDTLAAFEKYDLIVVSEAIGSGHAFAKPLLGLVNRVPMLNFKSFFYKNTVWNWGAGMNPSTVKNNAELGVAKIIVNNAYADHQLFANIEVEDSTITLFKTYDTLYKNLVQGYTATADGFISADKVLAKVKGTTATYNAIHEHGTANKYMLLPISSDVMMLDGAINLSDNAFQMISNAVYYLIESRGNVLPATPPTFSLDYGNNVTHVTMSSLTTGAKIYYTKDGTVPTISSSLYSDIVDITDSCTIKAFAVKQGYDNSAVTSVAVAVKSMAATPVITVAAASTGKTVTITAEAGTTIYYTTNGGTPKTTSSVYSAPLTITRPCVIKALVVQTGKLNSAVAEQAVAIDGYVERGLTLAWANFNTQPTTWVWANTDTTTISTGDVIAKYAYTIPTVEDPTLTPTLKTVDFNNGFKVGTYGQRINLQSTGVALTGNYSPETEGDAGASDRAMSFLTTNTSADPTTAYIVTTQSFTGPFDVTVWFTGAKAATYTEKLQVSVASSLDATTWTVLDTLTSIGDKLIRKKVSHYDATTTAPVYVKLASVSNLGTNSNMMIFDLKIMGEGIDPVAIENPVTDKTIVSTRIYTLSGIQVKTPVYGVNIIKNIYSDGSVETKKVIIKELY